MKYIFFFSLISLFFFACNDDNNNKTNGDRPTKDDVITAMKKAYEYSTTAGDQFKLDVHDVKIGSSDVADSRQEFNGVPKGATVTNVEVDYTLTGHITARKQGKLWVYKNEFGEWKFKAN